MLLICPECDAECTVNDDSAETATCPGCGCQFSSRTNRSGDHKTKIAELEHNSAESSQTCDYKNAVLGLLLTPAHLPRQLGRYTLTRLLGTGGYAHVYQAFDAQLGREVALKIPRRDRFPSKQQLAQFLEEARTCAKLEHPGIVRIYDVEWLTDDVCCIAMELCAGGSMELITRRAEKVAPQRAAELVAELAEAIHVAHLNGLVHRDLKPSNILFGADGRPRIADFGLAMPEDRLLNVPGQVAGTLPYMSPEQVRGESHLLDGRSDIWSLGTILYQLLTGRRPFLGENWQLSEQILKRDPKPLRQIVEEVPIELEQICLKCLCKATAERWATAKDLASQLRSWLQSVRSTVTTAEELTPPALRSERTGWWRTRAGQGAIAAGLIGVTGILAFALPAGKRHENRPPAHSQAAMIPGAGQPGNWSLDQAVPLRQYPLLVNAPQKLAWPVPGESASVDHSADEAKLSLTSAQMTLIELADTEAGEFELAVTLYKNPPLGSSGLFWGYRPDPADETKSHCYAVFFKAIKRRFGDEAMNLVVVGYLTFQRYDNGEVGLVEQADLASEAVDPLPAQGGVLNVRIDGKGLRSAKWNGQSLKELTEHLAQEGGFAPCQPPPYRSSGRLGLLNQHGNSLYRNATFTLMNGNAP